ncbi:FAD dependent oxidoreductase [Shewanella halifaxensis HAW-EB4]|uniref:tRNA 5-methylaminomethyl-2-thiouridine biosynthesis bifunctional protein MnmC n=1 Tax=Shewanella halifaxensis (strain HAW-EB4) TaxID=458817 RepID=MNMC_SHEHH|nr:bifunctional tRNA (5-methylaminomethyl-2-thiouridine)(34)-methyltransferase MnmD/FAD-dependent 5-carboxymethylaminomethyl-2-thiouridine(34) oxidoreductase MnmC [Shewanella halifaxensis]B0TL07.1 RecName: Full=tRNA 5-methylaminomethyl-2-thiouridine biosynthesis bifunctional protein MnmC; Short=tRNA mnm(5)s(2)U biosynthesis bifunctional protein; Includes: RecName: Full=tRNA (mnm(5)s(2)U34)-methyltransferase; Includes: RecName: Full=FAD-dependent cmnm(5)s(2)U34 oxidoreductase [Shewanella halifaxens
MTVSKILKQVINRKTTRQIVIAQLGLGSLASLKQLIIEQLQLISDHRVTLKIFSQIEPNLHTFISDTELAELFSSKPNTSLSLAAIEGCQRIIVNDGKLKIDFHLGSYAQQLQQLPIVSSGFIDGWNMADNLAQEQLDSALFWQMAKLAHNDCLFCLEPTLTPEAQQQSLLLAEQVGLYSELPLKNDDTLFQERAALRAQSHQQQAPFPICPAALTPVENDIGIAIIGGGVASACLALSLAERDQRVTLFCEDDALAQAASGNKQGAIYPLLTPDNNTLSQYFQQAYLFSLQRLKTLAARGHKIDFDLCGVVHTGHDERSRKRVAKITHGHNWEPNIALAIAAEQASNIAGVKLDDGGLFYPQGGWVSPQDFTRAAFNQAQAISDASLKLNTQITGIHSKDNVWYLSSKTERFGPFKALIVANGKSITQYPQTQYLQATGFRGQVSHVPSRAKLSKLSAVLCAHGYMTPSNNDLHCLGASYVKNAADTRYSPSEQVENLHKIQHSYIGQDWIEDIDVSGHSARVDVRMVTRDHAPMMGPVPNLDAILALYQQHQLTPESRQFWQTHAAPTHKNLYVLGGLGSRGLCSGPLAAEALAAQICGEPMPISLDFVSLLNPNRMWMRKLLKGKALEMSGKS